jgi:TonB-linked SusC/RagA family outer membrane protein
MKKTPPLRASGGQGLIKVILLMKLTIAFILMTTLNVSANVFSQTRITLKLQSAELKMALKQIEKKSSYRFLYNDDVVSSNRKVDINANNTLVTEVLDKMFSEGELGYRVLNNNLVVITSKNAEVNDIRVSGRVTNSDGSPVPGVSVKVKGSSAGTSTGSDGSYSISVPDGATLVFSSVGYESEEIKVSGRSTIDVVLRNSVKQIEQVVVVGYGSQRKIDVTGAVGTIKGDEISKQSSVNAVSGLQGKVAGVQITNNGAPGSAPDIKIRGVGTVFGSSRPLFVVDGVWFDDISFLNPADIDNMSILKDASSESIYGIRAANGVVLITTKKGKAGKAQVTYNGTVGYQKVTNQVKMANAREYTTLVNEKDNAQTLDPARYNVDGTDWYHQILRNAFVTNHQISVSGGADRSNYNVSFGFLDQDGLVETNNYKRYTARLQHEIEVAKPFKLGYTLTGAYINSRDINGGIFRQMYTAYPVLPVYYADGSYGDAGDYPLGDGAKYNPQVTIDYFDQNTKQYRLTGNVFGELKFLKYFTFRSSIGGERTDQLVRNYAPVYNLGPSMRNDSSLLTLTEERTRNWLLENTLTFEKRFGKHSVKALAGQGAQSYRFYKRIGSAKNLPNGSTFDYLSLGVSQNYRDVDLPSYPLYSTIASYFGRINYSFNNKYMLTASIRADGSSKYATPNKWGYFPSVGVGWVVTKEKFMESQKIFDNLKLRASWGKVGNASVPANLSVQSVTQTPQLVAIFNGQTYQGASIDKIVPPTTFWEKSEGTDVGVEATLLKNRLNVEIGYYNRKTLDAIFEIPILGSLGVSGSSIIGNQATFQNRGMEFLVNWKDDLNKNISYSVSANFAFNNNKVLSTATGANPIYGGGAGLANGSLATRTVLGQPIGHFYGYQVGGIFQTDAEAAPWNAKAGDFRYVDQNNDNKIDGSDRVVLGNPNPKYSYGINTNWTYKQFDLAVDFQGVAGVQIYNANVGWRYGNENFSKDFYDNRWHGAGTSNTYPSARIGSSYNAAPNSFFVENGSYFRIRNVQLGYVVNAKLLTRLHISRLRAFVNTQNPFTFFRYKGFSPEIGGGPTSAGIDANVYPLSATYNFGVNVSF